jgi:hypothetical protein
MNKVALPLRDTNGSVGTLTGTSDWKKLSVKTKPPFGAVFAALVIRVEENTRGTIWIDDAEFSGYGAEPLEITSSFLGYHPKSDKQVVVKSRPHNGHCCRKGCCPGRVPA